MAAVDLRKEGLSFLLQPEDDDKMGYSELNSSLDKVVEAVNAFTEMRADIFMEREEKIQQYKHDQLQKLKSEEEYYIKKCLDMKNAISDCLLQQSEIESTYADITNKLEAERNLNKTLNEELQLLKTEKRDVKEKVDKTLSLLLTLIQWYEKYLNITISINKENSRIITFYFQNNKKSTTPWVKFEVSDDFIFKVIQTHQEVESDKENFKSEYNTLEVAKFIYNTHLRLEQNKLKGHAV